MARRGFTLMEVLAVVAAIAMTAAIALPAVGFLRESWIMRQRNAQARTVFLAAQGELSRLRASGGLDILENCPEAVPQMGEALPEGRRYGATGDGAMELLFPEPLREEGMQTARVLLEFDPDTGTVASVFYYEGTLDIVQGYRAGQLPRDAKQRRKLLLGYYDGSDLPEGPKARETVEAELRFENGQDARVTVLVPTRTKDLQDLTGGDHTGFLENLEIHLTITGERGGECRICVKPRGTAENCRPGSTAGGMEAVAVTALLDSLDWAGSLGGGIAPGDNVSVTAEVSSDYAKVADSILPGISPLFGSLTEDGSGGLRIHITNGRHLQNLNKLAPDLARRVSAVVFTGPEGTLGKGEGGQIDWQETSGHYGGRNFTPISNEVLLENADFVGNETAVRNLKIETDGDGGLFTRLNGAVDSLLLVDPEVTGGAAAGALAARTGEKAVITGCGVFCEEAGCIRGEAAGGLVGICSGTEFTRCFAAVNVEGEISGGFAGTVTGAAFDRCYASGTVMGSRISGGFLGSGEETTFSNCFATGDAAGMDAVGGFAGRLTADGQTRLHSCYSLGLAIREAAVYENFCGETLGGPAGLSDYYKGCAEAVLAGTELTEYRFKDCYYLAGNYPGAAYGEAAASFWASPMDHETLGSIRSSGKVLLDRLMETPFDSPEALERAKNFLKGFGTDLTEILEKYQGLGAYQIYFDAAKAILGDTSLKTTYRKAYASAFPGRVWEVGDQPFPVLKGLDYYGSWPGKAEAGDFGILYYERLEDGLNLRRIRLSDGTESASRTGTGAVLEAGYGLYCRAGSRPFSEETFRLAGEEIPGLLPEPYAVYALAASSGTDDGGNPVPLTVSARYWGKPVTVVPEFADTLNRTGTVYRIRTRSQLEAAARYPGLAYMLEGEVRLDASWQAIPELRGSLTGTGEIIFENAAAGLVDTLRGGTLEGIRVRGKLTLSGTAGCLANRVTEGGTIRDCSVTGAVTLENPEVFGPVAGILEAGEILRTDADVQVTGTAACQGAFLGWALGGTLRDCRAVLGADSPAFAGFAASEETPLEQATHVSRKPLESSRVDPAAVSELTGQAVSVQYKTTFENCGFLAGEALVDALETRYYYALSPMGGWNRTLWEAGQLPQSGEYLLVTEAGALLRVKNGQLFRQARWDMADLTAEDFWRASPDRWQCRELAVTLVPGEGTVTVSWQEPVLVSGKAAGESEPHTREENPTRQAVCRLYEITENTDCRAVPLGTVRRLWTPWEDI